MDFALSAEKLDVEQLRINFAENHKQLAGAGAIAYFEGRVRNVNEGRLVTALDYEIYDELALSQGTMILQEAAGQFGLIDAYCVHRFGKLSLGEISVWIAAAAPHRREAFAACQYIIDGIKHRLPIWKKEHYASGKVEWVNCQHIKQESLAVQSELTEKRFYSRQAALPELGPVGQERLKASRVLVIGAGGLGSAVLTHLAGAGIGQIDICDGDRLEVSNLHRQFLYSTVQIGELKAELAADRIQQQNPFIKSTSYALRLVSGNAIELFSNYDLVLDCTDTLETKLLVSESAIAANVALISASVYRFEGQIHLWAPGAAQDSPSFYYGQCLRCLWRGDEIFPVPTCGDSGILGATTGMVGSLQALEAIKYLLRLESLLLSHVLFLDLKSLDVLKIAVTRNNQCTACGTGGHSFLSEHLRDDRTLVSQSPAHDGNHASTSPTSKVGEGSH
jgi:adenylyltransferase/sulfurtransferase